MSHGPVWFKAVVGPQNRTDDCPARNYFVVFANVILAALAAFHFFENRLRRSQTGYRNAEGAAAHVCKTEAMAKLHRARIAAVFAANAELDVGSRLAALPDS